MTITAILLLYIAAGLGWGWGFGLGSQYIGEPPLLSLLFIKLAPLCAART